MEEKKIDNRRQMEDELIKGENNDTVNRRSLLKGLGTVGGVAAFGTMGFSSVSAKTTKEAIAEIDVTELKGSKRKKAVSRVLAKTEYKKLKRKYVDSGWHPVTNDATATKSQAPSETYLSVVIPFTNKDGKDQEEVNILWENSGETPTLAGYHSIDGETEHTITRSIVKSGQIVTEHSSIPVQSKGFESTANCPPGETYVPVRECKSYNWFCVVKVAGAFAAAFGACGLCASGGLFACSACLGAIINYGKTGYSCNVGKNCHSTRKCKDLPRR